MDECEALLATDADCARRAVSSRVRRLTYEFHINMSARETIYDMCRSTYNCFLLFLTFQIQLCCRQWAWMTQRDTRLLIAQHNRAHARGGSGCSGWGHDL